jgi:hypothetical protein
LFNEVDSVSSQEEESMSNEYLEEEMDSTQLNLYQNNCHQIQLESPPHHQNMMENNEEELSSNNDYVNDVLSEDGTFENIVEYAVLLPDSFVVLD